MEEDDDPVFPSPEKYGRALHDLKNQFSEIDQRALRELYRGRNSLLPVQDSELATILGLRTAEEANEECFRLSRLLIVVLQGKYWGLTVLGTKTFLDPKLHHLWRMDSGLARGMELAGLTEKQGLEEPNRRTGNRLMRVIRWLIQVAKFTRSNSPRTNEEIGND